VKKAVFKTDPARGGFISASIAPISRKNQRRFGPFDAVMFVALIVATIALMRLLLAR
jgi:hypothetical protein